VIAYHDGAAFALEVPCEHLGATKALAIHKDHQRHSKVRTAWLYLDLFGLFATDHIGDHNWLRFEVTCKFRQG
jgi:hypothetical protein